MLSVVLSLTGMTFYLLMRSERLVTQSFVTERTISRLAVLFRDDVHQSETGTVIEPTEALPNELALETASGIRVRYRVTKQGVARLLLEQDEIVSRDDFRLPECNVQIAAEDQSALGLRILEIKRPTTTVTKNSHAPRPLRTLAIQAYLNRRQPALAQTVSPEPLAPATNLLQEEDVKQ